MGLLMSKICKLVSIIPLRPYSLSSFEKDGSLTKCPLRKFEQGFYAFENNTGKPHPLVSGGHPNKRRGDATIPLTNYHYNSMWYGNISVGTPATSYTGRSLFQAART